MAREISKIVDMTEDQMRAIEEQIETVRQERFRQALLKVFSSFGYASVLNQIAVVSPRGVSYAVEVS